MCKRLVFFLCALIPFFAGPVRGGEINLYSINTGSFVYHLTDNHGQYTEKFDNHFFSVERRFSPDSKYSFLAGTLKNSFGDRCMVLGVRRDWYEDPAGWAFKGVYGYTGEFFFKTFSHCGDEGVYQSARQAVGIGFAPYIYHAVEYNFTDYFGVESGIIFPSVFVVSVHWSFK